MVRQYIIVYMETYKTQGSRKHILSSEYKNRDVLYNLLIEKNKSYRDVGKLFNICHKTVKKWAERNNVVSQHRGCWPVVKRKNNLNDDYFEVIDSGDKAYFLGLILTDGNVRITKNNVYQISMTLVSKDGYLLEALSKSIEYEGKLRVSNGYTNIQFTSKKVFEDLGKLGVIPRKSLVVKMPSIDRYFYPDLIRGIIDGDGCFYKRSGEVSGLSIVSGSIDFITSIHSIITSISGAKNKNPHKIKGTNCYSISYGKRECKMIVPVIYNGGICMSRKREKAMYLLK